MSKHACQKHEPQIFPTPTPASPLVLAQAALSIVWSETQAVAARARISQGTVTSVTDSGVKFTLNSDPYSPWSFVPGLRLNISSSRTLKFKDGDNDATVVVVHRVEGGFDLSVNICLALFTSS